jgi:hypothetical protein
MVIVVGQAGGDALDSLRGRGTRSDPQLWGSKSIYEQIDDSVGLTNTSSMKRRPALFVSMDMARSSLVCRVTGTRLGISHLRVITRTAALAAGTKSARCPATRRCRPPP